MAPKEFHIAKAYPLVFHIGSFLPLVAGKLSHLQKTPQVVSYKE
jgi:hypothetical protein